MSHHPNKTPFLRNQYPDPDFKFLSSHSSYQLLTRLKTARHLNSRLVPQPQGHSARTVTTESSRRICGLHLPETKETKASVLFVPSQSKPESNPGKRPGSNLMG